MLLGDFNGKVDLENLTPTTRNGEFMVEMLQSTGMMLVNGSPRCTGKWTRIGTDGTRSILDYVMATPTVFSHIVSMLIDEEWLYKLRGTKPTDHNTILLTLSLPRMPKPRTEPRFMWCIGERTDWKHFEQCIDDLLPPTDPAQTIQNNYNEWERKLIEAAHLTVGMKKVKVHKSSLPRSVEITNARQEKKAAKSAFNQSKKQHDASQVDSARQNYKQAHQKLLEAIQEAECVTAQRNIDKIIADGGVHSKQFWNTRRRVLQTNTEDLSCLRNEKGEYIHEKEEVLQYTEQYFTNLYSPNTNPRYDPQWTQYLEALVDQYSANRDFEDLPMNLPLQRQEVADVIKKLPANKSPGPDQIKYEFLKKGGAPMERSLYDMSSNIFEQEKTPYQWQHSTTTCIPKGKKDPEYLVNKRALTLSSNMAKYFERLIVNRVNHALPFTEAQAGARKGRSTTDQVFILKSVLRSRRANGQLTYLAFLDIKQAYDQVWKAAVMVTLWERGIRGKIWRILRLLNTGLTTDLASQSPSRFKKVSVREVLHLALNLLP